MSDSSELPDIVNHPSHYTDGKIECIDFIEDQGFGFHLGNAVKYISRCGKKNPKKEIEDLQKAKWYIQRAIDHPDNNFSKYPSLKIKPAEYCHEKKMDDILANAMECICVGSLGMAAAYIDLYIKQKGETKND